jgi:hypothetical protein
VLAATALLAAAVHLARAPRRREALVSVAALFLVVAVVDGAPMLGDDTGGILTLVPIFVLTLSALAGGRLSPRAIAGAAALTVAVVGVAAAVDGLRPAPDRTHLGRMAADTWHGGPRRLLSPLARRLDANVGVLRSSVWPWAVPVIAVFLLYLLVARKLGDALLPMGSPLRVGVQSALAAGLLGFAVNDSGVVVTAMALTFVGPFLMLAALGHGRRGPTLLLPPGPRAPLATTARAASP